MIFTDGGVHINGQSPLLTTGSSNPWVLNPNYYPSFSGDTMYGTLTSVIPGQYLAAPGITQPVSIAALGTIAGCPTTDFPMCGTYILTGAPNAAGTLGSPGSPVAITLTGIGGGGALAPGPALTIRDQGPGVTFPATSISCTGFGACTGTGSVTVSGTFDTSVLGGAPTTIQAQVSLTAGGPPVPGCAACSWTNLSDYAATLSSGTVWNWSGKALAIPASAGPLFVSVRAANGTAYATMPNFMKVGLTFDVNGEGNVGPFFALQGGVAINYFQGLWGNNFWAGNSSVVSSSLDQGPPLAGTTWAPGITQMAAGDRFWVNGNVPLVEGTGFLQQLLTNAFGGWPVTLANRVRDGVGSQVETTGNAFQSQNVALGDGSKTAFCSAAIYCANVAASGPLWFNAASLTGATLAGASISGTTLSIPATVLTTPVGIARGALEPGMVLTDTTGNITGSPTLVNCLTNCTLAAFNSDLAQTWTISSSQTVSAETMRADPAGGPLGLPSSAPWPLNYIAQQATLPFISAGGGFGAEMIQAGTFKILQTVSGVTTTLCQDTTVFAYNNLGGNCTGAGVSSSFVNYLSGDYGVTFSSPPPSGAVLVATWTNIASPNSATGASARPHGLDFIGDGKNGAVSALMAKTPGGMNGHVWGAEQADVGQMIFGGFTPLSYALGAPGYSQEMGWHFGTRFPSTIPGQLANTPFISGNFWRDGGAAGFILPTQAGGVAHDQVYTQWSIDVATPSTFSGTISGSTLTLSGAATGQMWEGEVLGCNPFSLGCQVALGTQIQKLASGTWGANGSTYTLTQAGCNPAPADCTTTPFAMENAVIYPGPSIYAGSLNDIVVQGSVPTSAPGQSFHATSGFAGGGGRVGRRWAAQIWGGLTSLANASNPTLSRAKGAVPGSACDAASSASPCFDITTTFNASATATVALVSGVSVATVTGGLSANQRPFVVGQALSCSGCATGQVITAVSLPPTQDTTRASASQVGNTFTITSSGNLGVTGATTVSGICAGTSGSGSNCIDVAFDVNTTNGTYGTTAGLATCGENNLNGNAPLAQPPNGICQSNGVGSLVKGFRIGTTQASWSLTSGTVYDDGADPNGGGFNQNLAFTCNIVAAKVVQCVKGPTWTSGVPALGQWASGSTFVEYGDTDLAASRVTGLEAYPGGQSPPIHRRVRLYAWGLQGHGGGRAAELGDLCVEHRRADAELRCRALRRGDRLSGEWIERLGHQSHGYGRLGAQRELAGALNSERGDGH